MPKTVVSRSVVTVAEVFAREGYNKETNKNTGTVDSLVSKNGNPVTALYKIADLGKPVKDLKPTMYLESILGDIPEVSDKK
jgi:hypothetical protein